MARAEEHRPVLENFCTEEVDSYLDPTVPVASDYEVATWQVV